MKEPRIPIALEGYPFIGFAVFITVIVAILGFKIAAFSSLVLTAFILYFFRDPERISPDDPDVVVAPADGRVILIEELFDDRFLKEYVYKVSIFMNIFNVHVNRIPFDGIVQKIQYTPGKFINASFDKASIHNERNALVIKAPDGAEYVVVQIAGLIARRIVNCVKEREKITKGDRYGMIRFGSRLDLYLPDDFDVAVHVGEKTKAGSTIIGHMK